MVACCSVLSALVARGLLAVECRVAPITGMGTIKDAKIMRYYKRAYFFCENLRNGKWNSGVGKTAHCAHFIAIAMTFSLAQWDFKKLREMYKWTTAN